jgi:hypothetical protein
MPKKYYIFLLTIAVIFFGLVALGIRALTNDKPAEVNTNQTKQPPNKDFIKDTNRVSFTVQGKLVGEEERRAVRIIVTPSERTIEILQGYDETVIKTQTFSNKQSAFDTFLRALDNAGFDVYDKEINIDERGACPNGKRYIYTADFNDNSKLRSWSASCSKTGSFQGDNGIVRLLFENQIPEYPKFISGTRLS